MLKKILLATLIMFGVPLAVIAESISNYLIDVKVEQSGELSIVETITYDFDKRQKHGIFRDIPFTIKRDSHTVNLGLYDFSVQMDGGIVEWEKSTVNSKNAGQTVRLKIGSAHSYVTGKHIYTIAYRVKKGVLPAAQNEINDAVRWNIIGTGWNIPITDIKANFFLPSSLSSYDITLSTYTGRYGQKDSTAQTKWINNGHLQVSVQNLKPYEGATVELAYPAGILDQNGLDSVKPTLLDWFLAKWHWIALVVYLLYFRKVYNKYTGFIDSRSVAVKYYPPKEMSVLEAGLVLDKFADIKDFSAAVLELAELGYIEIHQSSKSVDPLLKRTQKSTEGLGMDQTYLLDHVLFTGTSQSFTLSKDSRSKADKLRTGFKQINDNLYQWVVSDGFMLDNPQKIRQSFLTKTILYLLPVIALVVYNIYLSHGVDALFISMFPLVFGSVGIFIALSRIGWANKLFGFVFAASGMTPALSIMQHEGMKMQELIMGPFGVLCVIALAMFYTYKKIGRFTQKGAYARKHLLGLQEFVTRVKQDEIHRRLKSDPLYLEKLMPYAVLFDDVDHWLSFYDILDVQRPSWYHGNIRHMGGFPSALSAASTPPSNASGGSGFSGGGGFTGGGGGGGGGGSW